MFRPVVFRRAVFGAHGQGLQRWEKDKLYVRTGGVVLAGCQGNGGSRGASRNKFQPGGKFSACAHGQPFVARFQHKLYT